MKDLEEVHGQIPGASTVGWTPGRGWKAGVDGSGVRRQGAQDSRGDSRTDIGNVPKIPWDVVLFCQRRQTEWVKSE